MSRRKYENNTTEALIDAEMELIKEFEQEGTEEMSPAEVETTVPPTVTNGEIVNAIHVKIRRSPNPDSEVIGILDKGDKLKILEKGKEFWKVETRSNGVAYVASKFIKEV